MSALAVSQLLESSQEKGVELVLETSSFENQVIDSSVEVGNVKEILHWNQHIFKPSSTVHNTFFSRCHIIFYCIEHLLAVFYIIQILFYSGVDLIARLFGLFLILRFMITSTILSYYILLVVPFL